MGGNLGFAVLGLLGQAPLSGYAIIKRLGQVGWTPSTGSVYPLLESMRAKGLVSAAAQGRSKVYSITSSGRKELASLASSRDERVERMVGRIRSICPAIDKRSGLANGRLEAELAELRRGAIAAIAAGVSPERISGALREAKARIRRMS